MKVLRRGNKSIVWPREFECPHCEALLALDLDDIRRNSDYTGSFNSWYINCPECEEQPDVPAQWESTIHRLKREANV